MLFLEGLTLAKRDAVRQLAVELARSCADDRCEGLTVLDMRGLSVVTDYFVIATGTSDRQIRSTADHLLQIAKGQGVRPMGVDGYERAHWILIDLVDVVVHVFSPAYRQLYDLELLWGDAPRVRWQRRATTKKKDDETADEHG